MTIARESQKECHKAVQLHDFECRRIERAARYSGETYLNRLELDSLQSSSLSWNGTISITFITKSLDVSRFLIVATRV